MNLRSRLLTSFAAVGVAAMQVVEAANVKVVLFAPTLSDTRAAASKPFPKTTAEETADAAGKLGATVPGGQAGQAVRATADTGKKLFALANSNSGSRTLQAEAIKKAGTPVVAVAYGTPAQTAPILAALQSTNFTYNGAVGFIAADDTVRPLKGDFDDQKAPFATNGAPLVVFFTQADLRHPIMGANGLVLATPDGAKTVSAQLTALTAPATPAPAAPAATNNPAAPASTTTTNQPGTNTTTVNTNLPANTNVVAGAAGTVTAATNAAGTTVTTNLSGAMNSATNNTVGTNVNKAAETAREVQKVVPPRRRGFRIPGLN